jgi:FKBP-type peptidyl-prolyl cis-trans isomerase SlyD
MISENKVVSLHYRLKDSNKEGDIIEETFGDKPLVFIYGVGSMIPKFEEKIEGKGKGDHLEFEIAASEAYGERDEEAILDLPIDLFKVEGTLDMEMLSVGNVLPMQDNEGNKMDGIIVDVTEDHITMDFNHPMAGTDLYFEIEIIDIREATSDEISHGHVHGEGGHHHH